MAKGPKTFFEKKRGRIFFFSKILGAKIVWILTNIYLWKIKMVPEDKQAKPRGKSLEYLVYEISRYPKGFLLKAYESSDLL